MYHTSHIPASMRHYILALMRHYILASMRHDILAPMRHYCINAKWHFCINASLHSSINLNTNPHYITLQDTNAIGFSSNLNYMAQSDLLWVLCLSSRCSSNKAIANNLLFKSSTFYKIISQYFFFKNEGIYREPQDERRVPCSSLLKVRKKCLQRFNWSLIFLSRLVK